jgi:hypothetical protein
LIIVADGVGVGVGDGDGEGVGVGEAVGVGVGVGVGVSCACAEDTPMASTKTMAASRAKARPAPVLSARDAQRMNSIPEKSARPKNCAKSQPASFRFAPSSCGASIGYGPDLRLNRGHCCSAATGGSTHP